MNLLSAKLDMTEKFSEEDFFKIIARWLKEWSVTEDIGKRIESGWDSEPFFDDGLYSVARILRTSKDGAEYALFRIEQKYYDQEWTTEVIFRHVPWDTPGYGENKVYFHVGCSEYIAANKIPECRTNVISEFVASGLLRRSRVPVTDKPVEVSDDLTEWFQKAVDGRYAEDIPLVMATEYFNHPGGAVDETALARRLAGFAYVAMCDNDFTQRIRDRYGTQPPFNGFITVYTKDGKPKPFFDRDERHSFDDDVTRFVRECVTASVDRDAPTWDGLDSDAARMETEEHRQLLKEADDDIYTMKDRIKALEGQVSYLTDENADLKSQTEYYKDAFKNSGAAMSVVDTDGIDEFYEGELHDLVVSVLKNARQNSADGTRKRELLDAVLGKNGTIGEGMKIFDTVKDAFAEGDDINDKNITDLRRAGFELKSENEHYKIVFRDSRYWFTVSKTSSDVRAGRNLISEITRKLSVYE